MVPVSPNGHIIVTLESLYQQREGRFFIDTTFNPHEHSTVTGTIQSLPLRRGINGLRKGDEIAFSYLVVAGSREFRDNAMDVFYEDDLNSISLTSWTNKKKQTIYRKYLHNNRFKAWLVNEGVIVDQILGTEGDIESWMGKFTFNSTTDESFKYRLPHDGIDYWRVPVEQIYAVKRGRKIETVPGYLLLEKPTIKKDKWGVELQEQQVKVCHTSVTSELKPGEVVCVDFNKTPSYKIWGKEYLVARENQILLKCA